ncbi:PREDICTED: two-component response regulator ARR12 isoform X3 [Prunus mume]|uniref:Two-component response regulator n=1 Tax=Prunus mume TaxID=102107 RepID=A0ABM0PQF9_PRUMU|nr:PREDICTED: two-component response regulator ARR12 isoform X3 [Prunus mume]
MTVKAQRGGLVGEDGAMDRFPVGMRVLAVDDNPICLRLLEGLLQNCQYQVTTTTQAVEALLMLRESRNRFDLVITDVSMPDMDGFKLLELLGLEMDLPVIMLSGHSDKELVMKGIAHGACDYLLKPVRKEELTNIWQHVIRRKKFDSKDQNKSSSQDKACHETGEGGQGVSPAGSSDQNGKFNRKRKDQNEDEEEEYEDDEHENEDPSTQKKPRVVWSKELHGKFVAAVHQLGLERAVPKKILDLMNVQGLTRENVASHLQKYRLCLKRLSSTATQQASMVAAFGGKDSSYMRMGALDGFGDLRSLAGSRRLSNATFSPYAPGGMLGRLNSPAGLSIRGITSSGLVQPGHSQNLSNSISNLVKLQPALPANQSPNLYESIPTSLELNQLQQGKHTAHIGESNPNNDPTSYSVPSSFPDTSVSVSSIHSDSITSSSPLILHRNPQQALGMGVFGNRSSLSLASLNPESFDIGISSNFLDDNRCSESWQVAVQLSKFPSNDLPMSPAAELRGNMWNQEGLIGDVVPTMDCTPKQRWEEHKRDYDHNLNLTFSATNPTVSANVIVSPLSQSLDQSDAVCSKKMNSTLFDQLNGAAPTVMQLSEVEKAAMGTKMKPSEDYPWEQTKSHDGLVQNSYESLNDIMGAIMKGGQNENMLMDGEFWI